MSGGQKVVHVVGCILGASRLERLTPGLGTKSEIILSNAICASHSTTRGEVVTTLRGNRGPPCSLGSTIVCCTNPAPTPRNLTINTYKPAASDEVSIFTPLLLSGNIITVINGNRHGGTIYSTVIHGGTICLYTVNNTNTLTSGYVGDYGIVTCSSLNYRSIGRLGFRSFPLAITISYDNKGIFREGDWCRVFEKVVFYLF